MRFNFSLQMFFVAIASIRSQNSFELKVLRSKFIVYAIVLLSSSNKYVPQVDFIIDEISHQFPIPFFLHISQIHFDWDFLFDSQSKFAYVFHHLQNCNNEQIVDEP